MLKIKTTTVTYQLDLEELESAVMDYLYHNGEAQQELEGAEAELKFQFHHKEDYDGTGHKVRVKGVEVVLQQDSAKCEEA